MPFPRLVDLTNVSANIPETNTIYAMPTPPAPGVSEDIINLRLRISTNVVGAGNYLMTMGWFDGKGDQLWQVSLNATLDNYSEQPMQIWWDRSKPLTYKVDQLSPGGSVDIRVIQGNGL